MPPVTPSRTLANSPPPRRPAGLAVLVLDLARGDFLERDRQVVLRAALDHRRRKLVERALAQVVVVAVDLTRPLGRDKHGGVVGVDMLEERVDARVDHAFEGTSGRGLRPADQASRSASRTIAVSSSTASSRRSLTTTRANSSRASSSASAVRSRAATCSAS